MIDFGNKGAETAFIWHLTYQNESSNIWYLTYQNHSANFVAIINKKYLNLLSTFEKKIEFCS